MTATKTIKRGVMVDGKLRSIEVEVMPWEEVPMWLRVEVKAYAFLMCISCSGFNKFKSYYSAGTGRHLGKNEGDSIDGIENIPYRQWQDITEGESRQGRRTHHDNR